MLIGEHTTDEFGEQSSQSRGAISTLDSVGSAEREKQLRNLLDLKLQALKDSQFKFTIGQREPIVREQVNKIVSALIYAKDSIGPAASAEPHAALAWAGVSILLPVRPDAAHTFPF
jgi:N-terminal domain of NWD NACHT-NTPase